MGNMSLEQLSLSVDASGSGFGSEYNKVGQ